MTEVFSSPNLPVHAAPGPRRSIQAELEQTCLQSSEPIVFWAPGPREGLNGPNPSASPSRVIHKSLRGVLRIRQTLSCQTAGG